ncbi:MAG: toll/interleukin-1 receptor domain-containing protein [Gammaproteobacteria bacterium]|nr:toll/interleukin-1 receptor domain-containing protein [Gammaproteobacteria bacterium]
MSQIFISYANEDTAFARRLAAAFEHEGWSVWWDKQIPPGMDYAQVIERAVNDASCIVVLWSQHSITSRWVHTEAAAGADRHIIATVVIDDTPGEQIPFEFRRLQAVNLGDWHGDETHAGYLSLTNRIRSILDEPPQPMPASKPAAATASWKDAMSSWGTGKQRGYRIGAAVAGLLGLGSCSEALDYGDSEMLIGSVVLIGIAVYLLHLGRKPG